MYTECTWADDAYILLFAFLYACLLIWLSAILFKYSQHIIMIIIIMYMWQRELYVLDNHSSQNKAGYGYG